MINEKLVYWEGRLSRGFELVRKTVGYVYLVNTVNRNT